ncbi:haloacid dehalogenase [Vallitalea longa]|uniref:Haloacid dehalogenase n=1 Tax=Vallitalea longa TaxID=2936439 RepID=A0A9W5YFS2_9FIRM|nr:HAD family hydrolase [Vallitalea longa]GKX30388.1 haloacid dehalogenase [Vallitalea longa]
MNNNVSFNSYIDNCMNYDKQLIIYFDIDGTLINNNGDYKICINKINRLKKRGVLISIATGRSFVEANKIIEDIKPNFPCILSDGKVIFDYEKKYYMDCVFLPLNEYRNFRKAFDEEFYFVEEYENYYNVTSRKVSRMFAISLNKASEKIYINKNISGKPPISVYIASKKLLSYSKAENLIKSMDFKPNKIVIENYGNYWFKAVHKNIKKEHGYEKIIKNINHQKYQIGFFGDGLNDLEMMKRVDIKFIMGNAHNKLKNIRKGIILTESLSTSLNNLLSKYVENESEDTFEDSI